MSVASEPETWVLEFVSFPDDTRPVNRRVARLLKIAGKACGLKCIRVRKPTEEELAASTGQPRQQRKDQA